MIFGTTECWPSIYAISSISLRHIRSNARWMVSPVKLIDPHVGRSFEELMIIGSGKLDGGALGQLAVSKSVATGITLSEAAHATQQVIWGQFVEMLAGQKEDPCVVIRAMDSAFYEVTSADDAVLATVRSAYKDVRIAPAPVTSIPIEHT